MNLFPKHITINGQNFLVNEFIRRNHSTEHEMETARFIKEWYASKDYIETRTSGSTGPPKIIRLKKEFVMQSAFRTLRYFNLNPADRILHCLPVKFIAGKLNVVRTLVGNLDLYIVDPGTDFSFLQTKKFHFAAMVPHQVQKLLDSELKQGALLKNIGNLLIGGSAIPHSLEKRLQAIETACYSSYAMTETATHIALRRINGMEKDEYYHCLEEVTVQLSVDGCLQIYMPGLAKQPLRTSDLAEVENEKTFKITGRADNVIISGGIKYSPEQLEQKLAPYIPQPFLISSSPHVSLGQQLILIVEDKPTELTTDQLHKICKNQLTRYEQPRKILMVPEIPQTENGKPDRKKLRS